MSKFNSIRLMHETVLSQFHPEGYLSAIPKIPTPMSQTGTMDSKGQRRTKFDRPLSRGTSKVNDCGSDLTSELLFPITTQVSLSAFAYVFSELVQHCQSQINRGEDLEKRLSEAGYGVGLRAIELLSFREKGCRKERSIIQMLNFVRTTVWKSLFGRPADDLQISNAKKNE
eukprot:969837-Amorphochlora_amoeboformis.AAC.1